MTLLPGRRWRPAPGLVLAGATALAAACAGTGGSGDGRDRGAEQAGRRAAADSTEAAGGARAPDLATLLERAAAIPGASRREARSRLGEPTEVRVREVPNRHVRGAVDTLIRLSWDGVTARYHKSGANQKEFLASVEVTGSRPLRRLLGPAGPDSRQDLLRLLGRPDAAGGRRWSYVCCPGRRAADETLVFSLQGDSVVAVRAGFYVD